MCGRCCGPLYIHIKDLARKTGITVRTLRYYDSIGLLNPASKTDGGHRLYVQEDMRKLQQIQFFKSLGYSLKEIQDILTDPKWNWEQGLRGQLAYIMEEQERLRSMESSLRELIHSLIVEEGDQGEAVQKLIRLTKHSTVKRHSFREGMFSSDEIEQWEKLPKMGGNDPDSLEWIALIGKLQSYMEDPPESEKVQNVIRRMLEKQKEQFKGEDAFLDKLWSARKSAQSSEELGLYPLEPELLHYMEKAYHIFLVNERGQSGAESK